MPGGFSDTGPVTYATSGVSSTTQSSRAAHPVFLSRLGLKLHIHISTFFDK